MIVKFLKKAGAFQGVSYNTEKMVAARGELMKAQNFGALQGMDNLRPQDYINYLEALTARSSRIKYPQLHVAISCKGRSHSKEQLTGIAEQWLKGMGYGEQPYMLVFHNDTANNHLHIVSTRIGRDGKKIDHKYERIRAYQVLNRIMDEDVQLKAEKDIAIALSYMFPTRAQFMMILESQGYSLTPIGDSYQVFKFGTALGKVSLAAVDERIKDYKLNIDRLSQLRAVFTRYRADHDPALFPVTEQTPGPNTGKITGWNSKMADLLTEKFGIKVLFHSKDGKPAYAYTLIDHARKFTCKGGELMSLTEFTKANELSGEVTQQRDVPFATEITAEQVFVPSRRAVPSGLRYHFIEDDPVPDTPDYEHNDFSDFSEPEYSEEYLQGSAMDHFSIELSDDIDDEAILGMKRHRKRKARTNTR
ncbi:hypothetical protein HDC92_004336 [Pedobacter sp. AK017]|uniref:relaxase/mobilization nuclease domain-containing protein n=1 Tax=Pedobacter sp. AK017 TaxID=2723073 RepID=UPI00160ED186|nr:relaxase/mobilization nuclease domain-containing protein [Pedobacter sp. AK017]MBB5440633.1 hypothetical protein [Pedobacter sp. AK017]